MPSVIAVQPTEPRLQPSPAAPSRGAEPFSDLLDSAANARRGRDEAPPKPSRSPAPSASRSRAEMRAESLARGDTPRQARTNEARGDDAAEPVSGEQRVSRTQADDAPDTAEADAAAAEIETAVAPASGEEELVETVAPIVTDAVSADAQETADDATADAEIAEAKPAQTVVAVADVAADVPAETAATLVVPEGEAEIAIANTPQGAAAPAAGEGTAPAATIAAPQTAATNSAPALASDPSTEGEAASLAPPPVKNSAAADTGSTQTQAPKPAQPPAAAAIPADADPATTGDPDSQLPQQPTTPQADQLKSQQATSARPAEAPALPAPVGDASAPKIQINTAAPVVTPDPVRALAASLNPASLHAANVNERNPVPLTGTALAVEIISRMRDGLKRFDIRLDPPELGRVDVRLEVDRNGHATTRLTVDKPETLDLLQRDARALERALQQAGLKTDQGGLEFTLRQHANDGASDGRPGASEPQPDLLAGDEIERVEAVIEGYRSAAYARGGVDIRI